MGTSYFSAKIIEDLMKKEIPISTIITQPDRPVGRKKEITPPEAKKIGLENNIPVKQFEKIDAETMNFFYSENPDLIIVAAYGLILPKELLSLPKFGCINIHTSLLPALRGPSPIQTALLDGMLETGVSIMKMDEEVDHGPILSQKKIAISKEDNYLDLEEKLIKISNEILINTVEKYVNEKIKLKEQNHHNATFTKMIDKDDGRIIWSNSSEQIKNLHRAFHIWPKTFCYWQKENQSRDSKIIFWEMENSQDNLEDKKFGEVFRNNEGRISIKTGEGLIFPKKIQLEGKKPMKIEEFCNGYQQFVGTILN